MLSRLVEPITGIFFLSFACFKYVLVSYAAICSRPIVVGIYSFELCKKIDAIVLFVAAMATAKDYLIWFLFQIILKASIFYFNVCKYFLLAIYSQTVGMCKVIEC